MNELHVPFDPDFDQPVSVALNTAPSSDAFFALLGARTAFIAGFVLSLLTLMSIGFLVLLSVVI